MVALSGIDVASDIAVLVRRIEAGSVEGVELCAGAFDALRAAKARAELRRDAEYVARAFGLRLEAL